MQIVFRRLAAGTYVSLITRADGARFLIRGVGHMFEIPHDMAHFAVERGVGLPHGFWGSIAAGAVFRSMMHLGGRRAPHAAETGRAAVKANAAALRDAEILVGILNAAYQQRQTDAEIRQALARQHFQHETAGRLGDETVAAARQHWFDLAERWRQLPEDAGFAADWPEAGLYRRVTRPGAAALISRRRR